MCENACFEKNTTVWDYIKAIVNRHMVNFVRVGRRCVFFTLFGLHKKFLKSFLCGYKVFFLYSKFSVKQRVNLPRNISNAKIKMICVIFRGSMRRSPRTILQKKNRY